LQLKDVQSEKDERMVPLKKVGIKGLKWPLKVQDKKRGYQFTVADITISADLHRDLRGTHMSRFIEVLKNFEILSAKGIEDILVEIKEKLHADSAHIELLIPYFIWKESPVTKSESPLEICAKIYAELSDSYKIYTGVKVPIHTLCPCSKEISAQGAHNQRAEVEIITRSKKMIWFEDLIDIAEKSASCPIYTLLKRPDEKYVTEKAFGNPKFVEDVTRDVALLLEEDSRIEWYRVEVTSFESIHNHQAFACVEKGWMCCDNGDNTKISEEGNE